MPRYHRVIGLLFFALAGPTTAAEPVTSSAAHQRATAEKFLNRYCGRCHSEERFAGYWAIADVDVAEVSAGAQLDRWEKILRQTREGDMPPPERKKQPSASERTAFARWLQAELDGYSARHPHPGAPGLRRLNRAEYANAVRDLLHLDIEFAHRLPADDSGYGFDNIADVLSVSATLMDRYFAVAGQVSRLALGIGTETPALSTYQVPKDGSILNQGIPSYNERASADLPIDSRGGGAFDFYAGRGGLYEISGYLNANTNNEVDRLDANRYAHRIQLGAGPHRIGMSFRKELALDERVQVLRNTTDIVPMPSAPPQLLTLDFVVDGARKASVKVPSFHQSERYAQQNFLRDVLQINVEGPLPATEDPVAALDTPARQHILRCRPRASRTSERRCAVQIISPLLRRAYRRPTNASDLEPLMGVFDQARQDGSFEEAIATVLQALLVSPQFLFVIESLPDALPPDTNYRISDLEFATRLALFLWSSLPDDELLSVAARKRLRKPRVLERQLRRMLADGRARALTENFAGQWLFLRNLEHHRADVEAYPEFDVPLRQAMREETEQFFAAIVRENRSILEFIDADYSYLNERLARHYGIEGVYGPALRPVSLPVAAERGGLLGQGSLLTLTSYGNHTSVVRRGQWILDALLATPPPPPPPDVPALVAEQNGAALSAREQLALHRSEPACASCHVKMDPLGLALERYDAIGGYRTTDSSSHPIDVRSQMPDGTDFEGLPGLKKVLLAQQDQFARAFTEQLMTYALGRGVEATDQPAIRSIAADAAAGGYPLHELIRGIVESYAFNHRRTPS